MLFCLPLKLLHENTWTGISSTHFSCVSLIPWWSKSIISPQLDSVLNMCICKLWNNDRAFSNEGSSVLLLCSDRKHDSTQIAQFLMLIHYMLLKVDMHATKLLWQQILMRCKWRGRVTECITDSLLSKKVLIECHSLSRKGGHFL